MAGKHMATGKHAATQTPTARQQSHARQTSSHAVHAAHGTQGTQGTARPKRKRSILRIVSNVLIVVGVALLLAAGGLWGYAQLRYHKQQQTNKALAQHVTITEKDAAAEDEGGCPVVVNWAELKAVNDDVVGWIYVPGTVVNYPVYQGESNDEYLRTNALGEWSVGGQVFLDWENTAPGMVDQQSILYGHHLWDGTMFQPLSLLDDQSVFDATDTIWYVTETESYELEPLFMYYADPYDTSVRHFRYDSDEAFRADLQEKLARSVTRRADADQLVAGAYRVLTMSTCNYYDGYGRSILVAIEKNPVVPAEPEVEQTWTEEGSGEEEWSEGEWTEGSYEEEWSEESWEEESWEEESWEEESWSEESYEEESWSEGEGW